MKRGDLVQYWFDTGAMGAALLFGVVIAAGPKTFTVRWESGICNRIPQGNKDVTPIKPDLVSEVRPAILAESKRLKGIA